MELVEDSAPAFRQEAAAYEHCIKNRLDKISHTEVGRFLFHSFKPGCKIFIIPDPRLRNRAVTIKAKKIEGGGIRVHINPKEWGDELDDTLAHELTHASRFSYDRMFHRPIGDPDFFDAEEFYATQISNVYRSSIGKTQLYESYEGRLSSKGSIYSIFVERPLLIMALKYCLDQEALARNVARFPIKRPDFNPFRDYSVLERMALGRLQQPGASAGPFMPL